MSFSAIFSIHILLSIVISRFTISAAAIDSYSPTVTPATIAIIALGFAVTDGRLFSGFSKKSST
jgi:hypothetical protein